MEKLGSLVFGIEILGPDKLGVVMFGIEIDGEKVCGIDKDGIEMIGRVKLGTEKLVSVKFGKTPEGNDPDGEVILLQPDVVGRSVNDKLNDERDRLVKVGKAIDMELPFNDKVVTRGKVTLAVGILVTLIGKLPVVNGTLTLFVKIPVVILMDGQLVIDGTPIEPVGAVKLKVFVGNVVKFKVPVGNMVLKFPVAKDPFQVSDVIVKFNVCQVLDGAVTFGMPESVVKLATPVDKVIFQMLVGIEVKFQVLVGKEALILVVVTAVVFQVLVDKVTFTTVVGMALVFHVFVGKNEFPVLADKVVFGAPVDKETLNEVGVKLDPVKGMDVKFNSLVENVSLPKGNGKLVVLPKGVVGIDVLCSPLDIELFKVFVGNVRLKEVIPVGTVMFKLSVGFPVNVGSVKFWESVDNA